MTRQPRMPGDPAAGDPAYGPLNGLFDDLHHDARRRERERDIEGARLLRDPGSLRRHQPGPIETMRAMATRVRAWRA